MTACSTTRIIQPSGSASEEEIVDQYALENFPNSWTINGRISVSNEEENWYARFNWIQRDGDYQISFTGPMGETELQVSQIQQNISLKTPSLERNSQNHSLEELIQEETGWKFPVTSLHYWIQGRPDTGKDFHLKYNKQQQISDIFQTAWHIQYPKMMLVDEYSLPKKIIATEQNAKIKIIITSWLLGEASFNF